MGVTRLRALLLAGIALLLTGCVAARDLREMLNGEKKPDATALQKKPYAIPLKLHAAANLNAGAGSTPLGLLVRIYQLKDAQAFNTAGYESFTDPAREQAAFGADLIAVREVLLVPGKRYESLETLPPEANYFGVVALFQSPAPQRWKLAFESKKAQASGIAIGALACALTLTAGTPMDVPPAGFTTAHCE